MPQLFDYVEAYSKPHRFMSYLNDETTLEDMYEPIMGMFNRMEILDSVLTKAQKQARSKKFQAEANIRKLVAKGSNNRHNKCSICKERLIGHDMDLMSGLDRKRDAMQRESMLEYMIDLKYTKD